jgi:menaquinone-dependent protoporphyrinogen oxidase
MKVLVAYASKYGFTKGIADFVADKMRENGVDAIAESVDRVSCPEDYDAFVIGSAVFFGKWMREAREFVTKNQQLLAKKPVWLFSSGPTGTSKTDKKGRDLLETSIPFEIAGFKRIVNPRDHHVFYGGFKVSQHGLGIRLLAKSATVREALQEGDFRDWNEIEAWATGIAKELESPQRGPD